jgi:hypothetical protein
LEWTASAQEDGKRFMAEVVPLQHPTPNAELSLATDASDSHIRGVMQQNLVIIGGPLDFFLVN